MNRFTPVRYLIGRHINANIPKMDHRRRGLIRIEKRGASKLSTHARQKLRNTKGLREIVVRACIKCCDLFFLPLSGRENDDRRVRPSSKLPDEALSVAVGETEIHYDQLRPAARRINPPFLRRLRLSDRHALFLKRHTDKPTNIGLILHD